MMADSSSFQYSSRSIFDKGPAFTLETFSNKEFIVKDFVESLSDSAIPTSQRQSGPSSSESFDPKPLIRTFEHAKRRLSELSDDLELRENELSVAVRRAEAQHSQNATSLGRKLNQAVDSFQKLDSSFNNVKGSRNHFDSSGGVGNVAIEIGKKLEELDRQRRRALDAHFLIQCWHEVSNRGQLTFLENLRRSGSGQAKVRSAHIARQLLRISQRLDTASWNASSGSKEKNITASTSSLSTSSGNVDHGNKYNTREIIEKFSETLEKDLLKQFDEFYRRANFDGMRDCATVLYDFNTGASVIGLFLNQHQFFIDRSQLINDEIATDAGAWVRLADPDAECPSVDPSLQSLVDEVKVVVQDESAIIKRAFPYYELVLGKFLQRVFQQSIQQRLEIVLDKASSVSSLAFLRSLQSSRGYINALTEDLKAHGLTEHPESMSSQTALILDQQLDDLFVPYFADMPYIEREKKNLEDLYTALLFKFVTYHSRRKKTGFMSSLTKSGSELLSSANAKDVYLSRLNASEYTQTQKTILLSLSGLKDASDPSKSTEPELSDEDGRLSPVVAKRMLRWLAEGVGRSLELSASSETPKDVSVLMNVLISTMSEGYVEVGMDAALESAVSQESPRSEPDFSYLQYLGAVISITNLMVTCIDTVLIPLAVSSITIRREMDRKRLAAMSRIEDKINAIEQKTIDVALAWVIRLLSNQKKTDFRIREDTAWLEMLQTPVSTTS